MTFSSILLPNSDAAALYVNKSPYTVHALLVTAGTNYFKPLEVRVLFKREYNSRAGTIAKFTVSDPKKSEFSPNIS